MNAAELMDRVFDVYKNSFIQQVVFAAIVGVIAIVLAIVTSIALAFSLAANIMMPLTNFYEPTITPAQIIQMVVVVASIVLFVFLMWQAITSAGHILLSQQVFYGERPKIAFGKLPFVVIRVVSAIITQVLMTLPFLFFIGYLFYATFSIQIAEFLLADAWLGRIAATSVIIVFTLLVTLGYLIYSNIFSLAVAVAVLERRYFFGTVKRSWQLIRGEFWRILGIRLIWALVVVIINLGAQALFSFLPFMRLAFIFIPLLIGPLDGIMHALIYFNQRIKREGLDIEIALEQLENV